MGIGAIRAVFEWWRPVLDLGPDAERVAPPDQLQQHAVRVRDERVLVGRAAGEELSRAVRRRRDERAAGVVGARRRGGAPPGGAHP